MASLCAPGARDPRRQPLPPSKDGAPLPGKNHPRISWPVRVVARDVSRPRRERTGGQPSRRRASTAAAVRGVVAPCVVPLVAWHVAAEHVVASRSMASVDVATGTVSPGFAAAYVVALDVAAGCVVARHATGGAGWIGTGDERNGTGRGGMRQARRGLARRAADGAGRGRTSHCGARRMGRGAAVHGGAGGAGRCVKSRGAGPAGA